MSTHSSILVCKFHRQRSLAGYSLWGSQVGHDLVTKQQQMRLLYRIFKQLLQPKTTTKQTSLLKNEHGT